ncbi:MAG: hypothetical protein IT168_26865 [Bryobacterales bacterium]|nr:hypothetical protein [Bryobacterales bacterium]
MPNYKPLTIEAEVQILDRMIEVIGKTDEQVRTRRKADGPKDSLDRAKLVSEIGQAIDKVLQACDVAESNNLTYCKYITDAHAAAKLEMAKLDPIIKKLETAWDDKVAHALTYTIGQITQWRQKLTQDDEEFGAVKMLEYRGNSWATSVRKALAYAPNRTTALQTHENNRQAGIQRLNQVKGQRTRVTEYVTRAQAFKKTAEMLFQKEIGNKKNFAAIREECIDMAEAMEKASSEYTGQLITKADSMKQKIQAFERLFERLKVVTKEHYIPVMLMEPTLDDLTKKVKGTIKTMRIQLTEQMKKVSVKGMEDRYYKPQFVRAETAIEKLKAALVTFDKEIAPGRELIAKGKKAK